MLRVRVAPMMLLRLGAPFVHSRSGAAALCLGALAAWGCQIDAARSETQAPREAASSPAPARAVNRAASAASGRVRGPVAQPSLSSPPSAAVDSATSHAEPPCSGECPNSMVLAGDACIDRYEAHLVVFDGSGRPEPYPAHLRPPNDVRYAARSAAGIRPQGYISRVEAERACTNAGKRLCTVTEWYGACRGAKRTTYPYGDTFERGRCNVGKPHLLTLHFGDNARAWKYGEHFNSPHLNQLSGFLEPTGHYAGCASSYGAYDLVGNLHEWVSDSVGASLAHKLPLQDGIRRRLRANAGKGVFMGGFFSTTSEHGRGCDFVTIAHEPKYHDYSTGFRCCSDPGDTEVLCRFPTSGL